MTRFVRIILFAVVTLAAWSARAQDPPPMPPVEPVKPTPAPPRDARITGTVMCADTHRPARGATIMIIPIPAADGKTPETGGMPNISRVASDGTYVAKNLSAGEYGVLVLLPGYLSPVDDLTGEDMSGNSPEKTRALFSHYGTVVVRSHDTGRFDISLQRGASISGRVLYSDGSPASQINIDVQDVNAKPIKSKTEAGDINVGVLMRTMFMHQSQGTDDQGHFRIAGLRPGTYRVAAVQNSSTPFSDMDGGAGMLALIGASASPHELHIYSGDTLHKKSAKTYELRSGDEVSGIDITVPTDAFHRVQGRLSSKDGSVINTASLTLTDTTDDSLAFQGIMERDGTFIFPAVPAGTYTLAATQARIGTVPDGFPEGMPIRAEMIRATNAFADGNMSVIVKESDVADVNLTLTEVPLPPDANKAQGAPQESNGVLVSPQ